MDTNKCWFVRTEEGLVELEPMTQHEALMLGEFLIANRHRGVAVYRGQLGLDFE
tara:strand:- start:601 stop:762 length:162 start_codon:yes stop_codon:yes gene_type:complete